MFNEFVYWFSQTDFYINYMSQWAPPFNNVSFDAFLLVLIFGYGIWQIYQSIVSHKFHQKLKLKQKVLEEKRIEQEKQEQLRLWEQEQREQQREQERQEDRLLNQYVQFMMIVQMQNITSLQGLSFDKWKTMKDTVKVKSTISSNINNEFKIEDRKKEFIDPLTGLFNEIEMRETLNNLSTMDLDVIYFHLTNSPTDNMLTNTADHLTKFFKNRVFRCENNSFIVLCNGLSYLEIKKYVTKIKAVFEGLNYSFAIGFCVNDGTLTKQEVLEEAERLMFLDEQAIRKNFYVISANGPVLEEVDIEPIKESKDILSESTETIEGLVVDDTFDFQETTNAASNTIPEILEPKEPEEIENTQESSFIDEFVSIDNNLDFSSVTGVKESSKDDFQDEFLTQDLSDMESDFAKVFAMLQNQEEQDKKLQDTKEEAKQKAEEQKRILDNKIKEKFIIEGTAETSIDKKSIEAEEKDFSRRREAALKQEEKEKLRSQRKKTGFSFFGKKKG